MQSINFGSPENSNVEVAILIKSTGMNRNKLESNYITPLGLNPDKFMAWELSYETPKKVTAKHAKSYILDLLPDIACNGIKTLFVADGIYFKYLTGVKKVDPFYGEVLPCKIKDYEGMKVLLVPNFQALVYNPMIQGKMDRSLTALKELVTGKQVTLKKDIIHRQIMPRTEAEVKCAFEELHKHDALTCDIEALSLEFWNAGISTIGFAWNKHEGVVLAVDRNRFNSLGFSNPLGFITRAYLKNFLETYKGTLIFHNAAYDMKVLVYELWMKDLTDYVGMQDGIFTLTRDFHDTKLITYLATNNAVENSLGLKEQSADFTGNYAEDVTDTSKIPIKDLLTYNLTDCCATWYVAEKHWPTLVKDQQERVYNEVMKPSVKSLLAMELCGMPINPKRVQEAKKQLTDITNSHLDFFRDNHHIKEVHFQLLTAKAEKCTAKAKKKVYSIDDSVVRKDLEEFNPGSGNQVQYLLYNYFGLPVIDLTDTKQPATGGKTLKKLVNHTDNKEIIEIIEHLTGYADASKILSTFIPAFENAQQLPDGSWRLYGNINLGGTQSLRPSSTKPNLLNIPSGSVYAKIIKACFEPTKGWLFVGSDFDALEDKVNALLTKDPNKLAVYEQGFCGHCMRAQAYFSEQMPDIIPNDVASINSIKKSYPDFRQDSKPITFLLAYGGSHIGLMRNNGFPKEKALTFENRYHELYKVADQWVENLVEQAKTCGYIPMAFGARIRTPLLSKCVVGTDKKMPYGASKEARSAGNAATQSYCVLTLRALNEFMERVWASPYRYKIHPSITIYDAIYCLVPNSAEIVKWVNDNLIECMAWDDLPELKHPVVKITSALDVFWPNWSNEIGLPVKGSRQEIKDACREGAEKYMEKHKIEEAA